MLSVIKELFFGNINPNGMYVRNSEYDRVFKAMADAESKLLSALNDCEKALYEEYADAQRKFSTLADAVHFNHGYILGAAMQNEIMTGIKDLILE